MSDDNSQEIHRTCKCGRPARPRSSYCRACHTAYMRQWRKNQQAGELAQKMARRAKLVAAFVGSATA